MKKIFALILSIIMLAGAAVAVLADESPFSDVKTSRWSYEAIRYVYEEKYMDGVGNGKFDPAGTMTRGMVVTVLYRMENSPETEFRDDFSDVKDGKYYSCAVIWAKDNNIVNGVSEGVFDPGGKITREQLATMLYRYADFKYLDTRVNGDLKKFPDADRAHSYAKDALTWATDKGLITGVKSGDTDLLDPRGNATREQFATILMRFGNTNLEYPVSYNDPVIRSHYTEKEYPLVTDADIYVSPDGDDSNPGSFDHPVATFAHAVEMVRTLKETVTDRSIVVALKAGEYHEENITMTAEDSGTKEHPVIYCAYGDGEAVITGGADITEDDLDPISEEEKALFDPKAADLIKKVDLHAIMPGYNYSDVLFGEDGALWIARFPNKYSDTSDCFIEGKETISENEIRVTNSMMQRRIVNKYHTIDGLKLYGYLTTGWFKDTLDVSGYTVDEETGGFDFWIPHPETARMGSLRYGEFPWEYYQSFAFLNMSEDLDADGEYWVDTDTLTMYIYNPKGTYTFTVKDRGINMSGCDYVTFRGLTVKGYREELFRASGVAGLTLNRCRFSVCSSTMAMNISGRRGIDFDTKITECEFSVFAGRVINMSGPCGVTDLFGERCSLLFDNNLVTRTNLIMEWNAAVNVGGCNPAVLSHNEFVDCSYMAICYGGRRNIIEHNVFKNCMYNSQDCGAVYCGNDQGAWGNKIRYNVFYPTVGDRYAVYLDDDEPAAEVYCNLIVGAPVVVHDGRSNDIHDNVFIRTGEMLSTGAMSEVIEAYNAAGGDPNVILENSRANGFYQRWVSFFNTLDADPELKAKYLEAFPEIATLTVDLDRAGESGFVIYPLNYVRNNWYFNEKGGHPITPDIYCAAEGNRYFKLNENPCFAAPAIGDYRIREGSGAPDIRFELAGRY